MKKIIVFILLSISVISVVYAEDAPKSINTIVAQVNGEVITQTQLDQQIDIVKKRMADARQPVPLAAELRSKVLNGMIDQKLELQAAKRLGIVVSQKEVDNAIADIASHNGMSVADLKKRVIAEGMDYAEYRKEIKDQITINRAQQRVVAPGIRVSDVEVQHYAKNEKLTDNAQNASVLYHLKDFMVALPDSPNEADIKQAQNKIQSVSDTLKANKNATFDNDLSVQMNDLGWRSPNQIPELFAQQLPKMQAGDISPIIRAPNGFHLIQLVEVKGNPSVHRMTQFHLRQIFIKQTPVDTDDKMNQEMASIRDLFAKGADFSSLVKKYSQDPTTLSSGGDLGWLDQDEIPPTMLDALSGLALNQVSKPIKTPNGWYLMQLLGKRQVEDSKKAQENEIREILYNKKMNEGVAAWIQQLRGAAYIEIAP